MTEHKVACPQCHSALRSSRPIPAGMKVKCPKCNIQFTTPGGPPVTAVPVAATAAAAGAIRAPGSAPAMLLPPAASPAFSANPPAPPPMSPPVGMSPPGTPVVKKPLSRGALLGMIGGGAAGLVLLAIVLVALCFSGDKNDKQAAAQESDNAPVVPAQQAAAKKPPAPLIVLPPELQMKVDAAVDKGVDFLKKKQMPEGQWNGSHQIGYTALAALTLLEAGVPRGDPAIDKAAKLLRFNEGRIVLTYEISLTILFLNRLDDRADKDLIQRLTLRLVAGQTAQGGWTYNCPILSQEDHSQLYGILKDLKRKEPADLLRDPNSQEARFNQRRPLAILMPQEGRPPAFYRPGGDNSNTQFAILALLAARKHDIPLERTLALLDKRFRNTQNPDGRWTYNGSGEVTPLPTMTCAGLLGVAIGFSLEGPNKAATKPEEDPIVQKGLEYLAKFIGEPGKLAPGAQPPMQQMYFLWSAERVAVLYQLKTIHGKKWYEWGVETLLPNQRPDGSWVGGGHGSTDTIDTCLAILFLRRVNLAKDLTDKLNELRLGPALNNGRPQGRKD